MRKNKQKLSIKDLAETDRPREKMLLTGRRSLSDAELMAILIGAGNQTENAVELGQRILSTYHNDLQEAGKASIHDLCRFSGIGEAKALTIIAALELGRRRNKTPGPKITKILSSRDIYELMQPVFSDLNHEEFWIVILNKANFVKGKFMISKGGMAGTVADPKIIFKIALEQNAANLVLLHNHPSGNLEPSAEDINITKKLMAAGLLLELRVLDHLIVTNLGYCSLADEGIIQM
jgi:DNA repair protein RadC